LTRRRRNEIGASDQLERVLPHHGLPDAEDAWPPPWFRALCLRNHPPVTISASATTGGAQESRDSRSIARLVRALRPEPGYRRLSLYLRVVLVNAAVLATATLLLALTPVTVSFPLRAREGIVLGLGLLVIVIGNALLLRMSFQPLAKVVHAMERADLLQPGRRLTLSGGSEVRQVIHAFNGMLDRLEGERQQSNRRAIETREGERRRIGQELHDEIGQRLTGILLQLEGAIVHASPPTRAELVGVQHLARSTLDEIGRIAWQLRPGILDDLGLVPALEALVDGLPDDVRRCVQLHAERPPSLRPEVELALYRIAQEALTNALRHAQATRVRIDLSARDGSICLVVGDNGRGFSVSDGEGPGLRGMRERALLIGARLEFDTLPGAGTRVRLDLASGN
jgi:two-component system sensor histidine kinase UhpB